MPETEVTVHVNRGVSDSLEVDGDDGPIETSESIVVRLHGHESPAHVHCRLDGDLERIASLETPNYYVEPGDVTAVPIAVDTDSIAESVDGHLEVLTGYGSEAVSIPVTVTPGPPDIDVDESLAEPSRSEPEPTALDRLTGVGGPEPATVAVVALGVVSLGIGTTMAATIGGPAATIGAGIVVVGFVVALSLLLR
ncbi:DUF7524 family protein [Halopiger djelfimassiliensis]|uniref:DUF7524 family protein n=1 Tax=Halopiger djelfimassiliensis TaxID=1293047 RepID=UPI000677B2A7|nr:hypothetical protein [Halopiger djelfimassiliensis]